MCFVVIIITGEINKSQVTISELLTLGSRTFTKLVVFYFSLQGYKLDSHLYLFFSALLPICLVLGHGSPVGIILIAAHMCAAANVMLPGKLEVFFMLRLFWVGVKEVVEILLQNLFH